jgi:formate hydrogenlyase transcriptional activator
MTLAHECERDVPGRNCGGLQAMASSVTGPPEVEGLLSTLSGKLCEIADCDVLIYSLYDPARQSICNHVWQEGTLSTGFPESSDPAMPVAQAWDIQQPALVRDVANETGFPEVVKLAREIGMGSFCWLPLSTAGRRIGALIFGSKRVQAFQEDDLVFLGNIARLVTLTMENTRAMEVLRKEKDHLDALGKISADLLSNPQVEEVFPAVDESLQRVVQHDFACVALYDDHAHCLRLRPLHLKTAARAGECGACVPVTTFPYAQTFLHGQVAQYSHQEMSELAPERTQQLGIQSLLVVPLINRSGVFGTLNVGSRRENAFVAQDQCFLQQVATRIGAALEHSSTRQEIVDRTERLKEERIYLQEEISSSHNFEEIIGESPNLRRALAQVQTVAPSDATVLILGETGTGKELVARAIHRMSSRSDASFVKLNCAAIPTGLLESELFGHEKGAFTGAISQKVGRLELADQGTLFLDEVGDIPLELQPKLLRVLQDQEFERLGGIRTIRVNVRLVAATNRDLPKNVAAGQFRSDLFYRLHVFPVRLPPLRERTSDIPRLIRYFVQKFARRLDKQIDTIPAEAMNALASWHWPGNVRELENFVERSVLLTTGHVLNMPLAELRTENKPLEHESTLHNIEREHILRVLRETGGGHRRHSRGSRAAGNEAHDAAVPHAADGDQSRGIRELKLASG